MRKFVGLAVTAFALSGCAFLFENTHQEIIVDTFPTRATCGLYERGAKIAEIPATPGSFYVRKSKRDLGIVCRKEGYHPVAVVDKSDVAADVFGNVFNGVVIGWTIDHVTISDREYSSPVHIMLPPDVPAPAASLPPSALGLTPKS